jgi:hypothetical protein
VFISSLLAGGTVTARSFNRHMEIKYSKKDTISSFIIPLICGASIAGLVLGSFLATDADAIWLRHFIGGLFR